MGELLGWLHVSPGFVVEINIVLVAVTIIFMVDLYNHLQSPHLSKMKTSICVIGLSGRVFFNRCLCLVVYLLNAILGIQMSKRPTMIKFAIYMIAGFNLMIYTLCIAISRYVSYGSMFVFYTNIMLSDLWMQDEMEGIEGLFDCCGQNGQIDYIISNRTWSKASCCELPNCAGCRQMFQDYLANIEMEIARDNIALFAFQVIGIVITIIHYKEVHLVTDPYQSDSSDYEDDKN